RTAAPQRRQRQEGGDLAGAARRDLLNVPVLWIGFQQLAPPHRLVGCGTPPGPAGPPSPWREREEKGLSARAGVANAERLPYGRAWLPSFPAQRGPLPPGGGPASAARGRGPTTVAARSLL